MSVATPTNIEEKSHFQLTRELELLISGALVFALLGIPHIIDEWWDRVLNHIGGASYAVAFGAYYVAKLAGYALITTILLHFLLRGFWVALLGLRGVFPEGIDQSRLDQGPFLRGFYERRLPSLTKLEDRVDRIAASVFAFVFLFLVLLCAGVIWASFAGVLSVAFTRLIRRPDLILPAFFVAASIYPVLQLTTAAIDRVSKRRALSPRAQKVGTRFMTVMHYATLNFIYAPLFFTFISRVPKRLISGAQVIFMYTLVSVFAVSVFFSNGVLGFDSYVFFPQRADGHEIRSSNYENLRKEQRVITPTIQSDVITEPYVRLFLPYNARRDNPRIRALCPDVEPFRAEGFHVRPRAKLDAARLQRIVSCFDRLATVELDGAPLTNADVSFYIHPVTGVRGRLAMIPATALKPGRHLLAIRRTPVPSVDGKTPPAPVIIPFWR